ncbi:hypothetical protein [Shimia abyssi]|uniref:Uncharacterized protein n=1 Tax=Shimia abyssi TaxID=1662395 RepID=A0A2P8FJC8_9RHOB|nr:hypothetical protein [Shimia abyssi]PSL21827.1 hypothetical protein CLV88_101251 [Shimia abyssi]
MRASLLILPLMLLACSRPLSPGEEAFMADFAGDSFEPARARIVADVPLGVATFKYEKRPRLSCRERIHPEPDEAVITTSPAGLVLWNTLYTSEGWYLDDYLPAYPETVNLQAALFFAHELTHIWQWQNRDLTGYSPRRAAREHQVQDDPYQFELDTSTQFLGYGYEQQASIVEEYLCCAALDPKAPRTSRLRDLLSQNFPIDQLPRPENVILPWEDAEIKGICRA